MVKKELAKMLGVDESTIWRWEKSHILDQKIADYQKMLEIKKQTAQIETKEIMLKILEKLEKIDKALEILPNIALSLQDIAKELQEHTTVPVMGKPIPKAETEPVKEHLGEIQEYMNTTQLANAIGVDKTTIQRWIKSGKLRAGKIGVEYAIPKEEALMIIFKQVYDDVNFKTNAGDSVSIKDFKDELKRRIQLSEEEINKELLDLDDKEILHLQVLDRPGELTEEERKAAIEFEGRVLFFITWMKK